MTHPHLMPDAPFKRLKERWSNTKHLIDDPEAFEPTIKQAIQAINEIPGLVTIWSCEGHPKERQRDHGYIMIGVQDINAMYEIYRRCTERTQSHRNQFSLTMALRTDTTLPHDPIHPIWYPVFNLSWSIGLNTHKRVNGFLCTVCEEVRDEVLAPEHPMVDVYRASEDEPT